MHNGTSTRAVPTHVPPELVIDFDAYDPPAFEEREYHGAFQRIHDAGGPSVFWSPYRGGYWLARRCDDLYEMFKDSEHFSSMLMILPKEANPSRDRRALPIQSDPPEHTPYRALISPAFSPKAMIEREADARALSIKLIEGFKPKGECDFVSEFAQHVPMKVFLRMVDLPDSDLPKLMGLAAETVDREHGRDPMAVFADIQAYLIKVVEERRARPGSDLISQVASARVSGRPIETWEILNVCTNLMIGGLDTVASTMGFVMNFLAKNPGHRQQLIDEPALIPNAVEELLRRFPVTNPGRVVAKDFTFRGVQMKQGDMVLLSTPFGALDSTKFERPLDVDFRRKLPYITTFGNGPHRCPGSFLARAEIKVMLQEWLPRIPDFRVKRGAKPRIRAGINGSFHYLPLEWDA